MKKQISQNFDSLRVSISKANFLFYGEQIHSARFIDEAQCTWHTNWHIKKCNTHVSRYSILNWYFITKTLEIKIKHQKFTAKTERKHITVWKPCRGFNESRERAWMKNRTLVLHSQRSDAQPAELLSANEGAGKRAGAWWCSFSLTSCPAERRIWPALRDRAERSGITNWQRFAQSCKIWRVIWGG